MELPVYNTSGASEGTVTVSDKVFHARMNKDLVYQVATSQMSNMRQVLAHTKTRAEVSGGGKKPWRQKGTGKARHGSIRSPIWVGGGVAHGPTKDVNFKRKINKAQGRSALAAVLSARVNDGNLLVVESLTVPSGKTRDAVTLLQTLRKSFTGPKAGNRILVVLPGTTDDLATRRAVSNLPQVDAVRAQDLNTLTALSYPYIICAKHAVETLEKLWR